MRADCLCGGGWLASGDVCDFNWFKLSLYVIARYFSSYILYDGSDQNGGVQNHIRTGEKFMRILLIPLAGGVGLGPLTRCLSVAHEAKMRGHEVLFLCKDTFCEIVRKFGYRTYTAPTPAQYRAPKPPPFRLSDVAIALGWIEESYINSAIEVERQIVRSFRPDVIFTETQFSVPISASI